MISKRLQRQLEKAFKEFEELLEKRAKTYREHCDIVDKLYELEWFIRKNYRVDGYQMKDAYYTRSMNVNFFYQRKNVLDLFSGIGNFSEIMEKDYGMYAKNIYLADIDETALEIAKMLNSYKQRPKYHYHKIDIFSLDSYELRELIEENNINLILLNPPFSQNFRELTTDFLVKLQEVAKEIPIIAILPETFEIPLIEDAYLNEIGTATFVNTTVEAKVYEIYVDEKELYFKTGKQLSLFYVEEREQ